MRIKKLCHTVLTTLAITLLLPNAFAEQNSERIPLNSISGYKFGGKIKPTPNNKINFTLKHPFLDFSRGIVHINPKTQRISAIELVASLPVIRSKHAYKSYHSLGNVSATGETERRKADFERKVEQTRMIEKTFSDALEALRERYHISLHYNSKNSSLRNWTHLNFHLFEGYYVVAATGSGLSYQKFPHVFYGNYGPIPAGHYFDQRFIPTKTPYGKSCTDYEIFAYDKDPSENDAVPIRKIYFCIDNQTLKIVFENFKKVAASL